jgi:hypothetical protein
MFAWLRAWLTKDPLPPIPREQWDWQYRDVQFYDRAVAAFTHESPCLQQKTVPMRLCGRCEKPVQVDDPLQRVQWQDPDGRTVSTHCCRSCEAALRGDPPPAQYTYPPGNYGLPLAGHICCLCFRAMFEDDPGEQMRIAEADINPGEVDGLNMPLAPGSRWCCRECVEKFRPRIAKRLGRPVNSVHGNWLL